MSHDEPLHIRSGDLTRGHAVPAQPRPIPVAFGTRHHVEGLSSAGIPAKLQEIADLIEKDHRGWSLVVDFDTRRAQLHREVF